VRAFLLELTMTDSNDGLLDDYVSQGELAEQLNLSPRSLQRWARQRTGPPITYLGRIPYYRKASMRAWMLSLERPMVRDRSRKRAQA
jgi:Helix-turn-helix domain